MSHSASAAAAAVGAVSASWRREARRVIDASDARSSSMQRSVYEHEHMSVSKLAYTYVGRRLVVVRHWECDKRALTIVQSY